MADLPLSPNISRRRRGRQARGE